MLNWEEINFKLDEIIDEIFKNENLDFMSEYEKRKIIFEYLCINIKYDYELLDKIIFKNLNPDCRITRNPKKEVIDVLLQKKGICNAIAQTYKLLLEKIGIYSECIICDDGTNIKHQLNLVYNKEIKSYSFDDVTSVIANRGTIDDYFDYDLYDAFNYKQGCRAVRKDSNWVILPTNYIYAVVGRNENLDGVIKEENISIIPSNIESYKKKLKISKTK